MRQMPEDPVEAAKLVLAKLPLPQLSQVIRDRLLKETDDTRLNVLGDLGFCRYCGANTMWPHQCGCT